MATAAAMTMVGFGPAGAAPPPRQDVIVVFDDDVRDPRAAAADMARQHDARVSHVYEHVFGGFAASVPEGRRGALERDPRVDYVSENRSVHATAETTPTGVRRISAPLAHAENVVGTGAKVGILDTGIASQPDLNANLDRDLGLGCMGDPGDTDDRQGHGTHVAGTVAAVRGNDTGVVGVAPSATLVPVKVLGDSGSGDWATVACGLDHAAAVGLDVVNLSLSGSGTYDGSSCESTGDALYEAVCGAIDAGVTVVVAAGNDGRNASNNLPAAYPDVITVSALEDRNGEADSPGGCSGRGPWQTCEDVLASFSNYGSVVDVIAPGVAITSTTTNGGTGSKSGTSMAAPHVAGVAALVIGAGKATGHHAVRDHLRATGQCPDTGETTGGACSGQSWPRDPDGIAEPLVHAAWAVAGGGDGGGGGGGDDGGTNIAPTASFTYDCTDLDCLFTDTSSDSDGSIASRSWTLGDGGTSSTTNPSHTYAAGGTYTVSLTVTDDGGATASTSQSVTVTAPPDPEGISLSVDARKVRGDKYADLAWTGATSTNVDVYRDLTKVATTANDGFYTDGPLGKGGGSATYRICEAAVDAPACSPSVTVSW